MFIPSVLVREAEVGPGDAPREADPEAAQSQRTRGPVQGLAPRAQREASQRAGQRADLVARAGANPGAEALLQRKAAPGALVQRGMMKAKRVQRKAQREASLGQDLVHVPNRKVPPRMIRRFATAMLYIVFCILLTDLGYVAHECVFWKVVINYESHGSCTYN